MKTIAILLQLKNVKKCILLYIWPDFKRHFLITNCTYMPYSYSTQIRFQSLQCFLVALLHCSKNNLKIRKKTHPSCLSRYNGICLVSVPDILNVNKSQTSTVASAPAVAGSVFVKSISLWCGDFDYFGHSVYIKWFQKFKAEQQFCPQHLYFSINQKSWFASYSESQYYLLAIMF